VSAYRAGAAASGRLSPVGAVCEMLPRLEVPRPIDHDAIEQTFLGKAADALYRAAGGWYRRATADRYATAIESRIADLSPTAILARL